MERIVHEAIVVRWRGRDRLFYELFTCTGYLDGIRYHFADPATLEYPWWPTPFDH